MFDQLGSAPPADIVLLLPALENGQKGDEKRQAKVAETMDDRLYSPGSLVTIEV
jgi:hypothetical protein